MSAIVVVQWQIRRALEVRLAEIADANNWPVQYEGEDFSKSGNPIFLKHVVVWGDIDVLELGKTPRFQGNGGFSIVISTPIDQGRDFNDQVAGIIAAGYPYADTLTFEGISLTIDKIRPGAYGVDAAWRTGMITIDWNIYRRP